MSYFLIFVFSYLQYFHKFDCSIFRCFFLHVVIWSVYSCIAFCYFLNCVIRHTKLYSFLCAPLHVRTYLLPYVLALVHVRALRLHIVTLSFLLILCYVQLFQLSSTFYLPLLVIVCVFTCTYLYLYLLVCTCSCIWRKVGVWKSPWSSYPESRTLQHSNHR